MWTCLTNCISWNIPEEEAVRAATYNAAKAIGALEKVGTIETGKYADFIVCAPDYSAKTVYIGGEAI